VQRRVEEDALLPDADLATLQRIAQRLSESLEALALPLQAVHGDAGPSNALNTTAGVLWTDWEDTFLGPRAWDLACLVSSTRIVRPEETWSEVALASYGPRRDDETLDLLIEARAFLVTVWTAVIGQQHPSVLSSLEARMKWFRERDNSD
jgi:thiamine kinase-like enzyme